VAPAFSISLYDAYTKPVGAVQEPAWRRFIKKQGWFSRPEAEVVKPPPHRVQASDIRRGIAKFSLGPADRILFHTADGHTYAALGDLLSELKPDNLPILHVCTPYDSEGIMPNRVAAHPIPAVVASWKSRGLLDRRVFL